MGRPDALSRERWRTGTRGAAGSRGARWPVPLRRTEGPRESIAGHAVRELAERLACRVRALDDRHQHVGLVCKRSGEIGLCGCGEAEGVIDPGPSDPLVMGARGRGGGCTEGREGWGRGKESGQDSLAHAVKGASAPPSSAGIRPQQGDGGSDAGEVEDVHVGSLCLGRGGRRGKRAHKLIGPYRGPYVYQSVGLATPAVDRTRPDAARA